MKKDVKLEYFPVLMEDMQYFGWNSTEVSHAILLCCKEKSRLS